MAYITLSFRALAAPVDVRAETQQEARQLAERRGVALDEEREADELGGGRNFERKHLALLYERVADARDNGGGVKPIIVVVVVVVVVGAEQQRLFFRGGQRQQLSQVQRRAEANSAHVAKICQAELVEILKARVSVVDEEQLDAALNGREASLLVHDADKRVRREDVGQLAVHVGSHLGPQLLDAAQRARDVLAVDGVVLDGLGYGRGLLGAAATAAAAAAAARFAGFRARKHAGDFALRRIGADKVIRVSPHALTARQHRVYWSFAIFCWILDKPCGAGNQGLSFERAARVNCCQGFGDFVANVMENLIFVEKMYFLLGGMYIYVDSCWVNVETQHGG
ncbi:hypothetical protein BM221_003337 [Beauveria bassiana]|uniref:Uncharacterized protein n=1 Tax=Beauveria bassiana TaxID=176275 RepID=A0A2N6NUD3_BEABA|nr:hypothetical protein BM221_003337 [Beauveria bassiana]